MPYTSSYKAVSLAGFVLGYSQKEAAVPVPPKPVTQQPAVPVKPKSPAVPALPAAKIPAKPTDHFSNTGQNPSDHFSITRQNLSRANIEGTQLGLHKDPRGELTLGTGFHVASHGQRIRNTLTPDRYKAVMQQNQPLTAEENQAIMDSILTEMDTKLTKAMPNYAKQLPEVKAALLDTMYNSPEEAIGPKMQAFIGTNRPEQAAVELAFGHNNPEAGLLRRRVESANNMLRAVGVADVTLPVPKTVQEAQQYYRTYMTMMAKRVQARAGTR